MTEENRMAYPIDDVQELDDYSDPDMQTTEKGYFQILL
jgi:hypothetical protein